jgi:hypothetical protein
MAASSICRALCTSDRLPLSEPAQAVRAIILELVDGLEVT